MSIKKKIVFKLNDEVVSECYSDKFSIDIERKEISYSIIDIEIQSNSGEQRFFKCMVEYDLIKQIDESPEMPICFKIYPQNGEK